jgi:hypothetical protein
MFTSLLLGAAGATIVCSIFVQAGSNYQWPHSALLRCRLMLLRGNKAMAIDYKLTENADFLSKFENARKATGERVNIDRDSLMEYCNAIYFAPSYVLAFAGYSVIIFTLHPLILALLVAGLLVSYRIGVWYDKLEYQSMERRRYPRVRLRRLPEKILCRLPGFWSHCCELTGKHLPCQRRT